MRQGSGVHLGGVRPPLCPAHGGSDDRIHSKAMKTMLCLPLLCAGVAVAQPQGSATVADSGRILTLDCSGPNDVITVRGSNNYLTLSGACEHLVVYGNGNTINGTAVQKVWLKGNNNLLSFWQELPSAYLNNTGNGNRYTVGSVSTGTAAPQSAAGQTSGK